MFTKIYAQLQKHLAFKSWCATYPTHGPNGVAQGCSLSLIAINVHMKVWVHLIALLPDAQACIDDAYLWAKLTSSASLKRAIELTEQWDQLVGQTMNYSKCTTWGTSSAARHEVKHLFPTMLLQLGVDVLGVNIRTSGRNAMHFSDAKCDKIVADIRNIAALPLPVALKSKLVGIKVVPQCTYAAAINQIPAKCIAKIQGAIANLHWGKRPHGRSRFLVFALLTKPHRVEPVTARHYNVILDLLRYLHQYPEQANKFRALLPNASPKHRSVGQALRQAFRYFSLYLSDEGRLSFRGRDLCDFLDLTAKDAKKMLQHLAKHACYAQASLQLERGGGERKVAGNHK